MVRKKWMALWAALLLLLTGCADAPATEQPPLTQEVAVWEGDGYRLTYPACFHLSQQTTRTLYFTVDGRNMAFTLALEENPYGVQEVAEYPRLMGIYGAQVLDAHSFGVERYQAGVLSGYYLYAFSADTQYMLEYNYSGAEDERAVQALFAVTVEEVG